MDGQTPARWYYEVGAREGAQTLLDLQRADAADVPTLLRGGSVLSMDPKVGDFEQGDVLLHGGKIAAVGRDLSAHVAHREHVHVELRGMVVMPGLVDAHRHCWQGQLRRLVPDADLDQYVAATHVALAPHYRAEDMRVGTMISLLGLLAGGVTTVLDFSHNSRSARHSDAVFGAYADAGIRAVHASATPRAGKWDEQWPQDILRLRDRWCSGSGGMRSIRLGLYTPQRDDLPRYVNFARANALGVTIDAVAGATGTWSVGRLEQGEALGPDVTLIHCTALGEAAWTALSQHGVSVTLAPTSDQHIGLGNGAPPVQQALDFGVPLSLSTDTEASLSGDMFSEMRSVLASQRRGVHAQRHSRSPAPPLMTCRRVVEATTIGGANAVGLGHLTGSLTPGKQADIVGLRGEDINSMPLNSPYGTAAMAGSSALVDFVLVGGQPRKWRGELVGADVAEIRRHVAESVERLHRQAPSAPWRP